MKRALILVFSLTAIAWAQNDKVTVPLSSPSQPATVKAHLLSGSITVTAGTGSQVVIQSEARGGRERGRDRDRDRDIPPGMHRIDGGARGFTAEEDHNVVTIVPEFGGQGMDLTLQVPVNTSLQLTTVNGGNLSVTGINGDLDVQNTNGPIILQNVSGSVSAHTVNGSLTAGFDRVTPDKPMSFSSLNGKVDVTLPADTKARLHLKTNNGAIYSDFDVKIEPDTSKPVVEDSRGQGGRYRIRLDRAVEGSINGGGPEYSFQTFNGNILIHKK
jgi:hypothetical protein